MIRMTFDFRQFLDVTFQRRTQCPPYTEQQMARLVAKLEDVNPHHFQKPTDFLDAVDSHVQAFEKEEFPEWRPE